MLPFSYMDNFTIIPIYVGFIEYNNLSWFAMKLMPYFKDSSNLFIFSLSLTHWGSIYDFTKLDESKPTVLDTIKEYDMCAIEALKTLTFKAFDLQICLAKTPMPDFPTWAIFLKLTQTLLDEEEYRCRQLPDEEFFKSYQEVAELVVHGQSW
uniref:Protein MEMO1 n=1 Tax=Mesocestoides corti TaxID=53468 RepID=A0A5K3FP51_MESCO